MKKLLLIFCLIILSTGCLLSRDRLVLKGHYASDEYWDKNGFQDYTDYCKYYYNEDFDSLFENHSQYSKVKDEDIQDIKSYFENFKEWMETENRLNEYDFDINSITVGDYIHIKTTYEDEKHKFYNYTIYLYDIETHTLIYIHQNM